MLIDLIFTSRLSLEINLERSLLLIMNKKGEIGSPSFKPHEGLKKLQGFPLMNSNNEMVLDMHSLI